MRRSGVGWNTVPKVTVRDFSGCRAGSPPSTVVNWQLHAELFGSNTGHLIRSRVPCEVTLVVCGAYRSVSDGARKPVPAEPRNRIHGAGCQRSETFGFTVLPTV